MAHRAGRLAIESNREDAEEPIASGFVRVGRIGGPHGLHGAVRVRPDNPDSDSLTRVNRVFLWRDGAIEERGLRSVQRANRATLKVALDGIDDANAAESLRNTFVLVAESDLPPAAPGEFYYYQAIGCEVVTTDGRRLGVVTEVFSAGANDVLTVRDGDREVLAPAIEDVIESLDLGARRIVVRPVPGLLD